MGVARLAATGLLPEIDQLTVNEYQPGVGTGLSAGIWCQRNSGRGTNFQLPSQIEHFGFGEDVAHRQEESCTSGESAFF